MKSDNGVPPEEATEVAVSRLIDDVSNDGGDAPPDTEPPRRGRVEEETNIAEGPDNGPPPHDIGAIKEVPEDAVHCGAERLNDPDEQRRLSVDVGRRLQAVGHRHLFRGALVDKLYNALGVIRQGAVLQPAQREGTELLKAGIAARADMDTEVERGTAAILQARRLLDEQRPALASARDDAAAEVRELENAKEQAEEALDERLQRAAEAELEGGTEADGVKRPDETDSGRVPKTGLDRVNLSVFEHAPITPKALAIVVPAELATTTLLLKGPISNLVMTTSPLDPYLIAAAISGSFLALGLVAGYAAAAMRLRARLAGALIVGLAIWLLVRGAARMDLLRLGNSRGLTILTVSTLATVLVAAVTAYAATRYKALRNAIAEETDEPAVLAEIGMRLPLSHPAAIALRKRDRVSEALTTARAELADREAALTELDEKINRLRIIFEETQIRVMVAKRSGIEAFVALTGLDAVTATALGQEAAQARANEAAAELGWRVARAEREPEEPTVMIATGSERPRRERAASRWQKLAIAVFAAADVAGLLVPSLAIAGVGTLVAAGLWWLDAAHASRPRRTAAPQDSQHRSITPTTDEESPLWRYLPSWTRPKYRRGSSDPTRRA